MQPTVGDRLFEVEDRLFHRISGFLNCTVSPLSGAQGTGAMLVIRTHVPGTSEVRATVLAVSARELARTDLDTFVYELAERIKRMIQEG